MNTTIFEVYGNLQRYPIAPTCPQGFVFVGVLFCFSATVHQSKMNILRGSGYKKDDEEGTETGHQLINKIMISFCSCPKPLSEFREEYSYTRGIIYMYVCIYTLSPFISLHV